MQQRCHIRIVILYDAVPRWVRKIFDVISTLMIVVFVSGLIFGSFKQVFVVKFYRWEMFGTALIPNSSNHSADDFDRSDIGRFAIFGKLDRRLEPRRRLW